MSDENRVALVTGTSSGFGRLTTETLAADGFTVFATMRDVEGSDARSARDLEQAARAAGRDVHVLELDVTDDDSVVRAVEAVKARAASLDLVVNNAGQAFCGPVEAYAIDELQRQFDVNVYGPMRVARAVLPTMRAQGRGLIVNISSVAGRMALPGLGVYCASKFALEALCETLRYEASLFGVDSVLVEPGAFNTAIFSRLAKPADVARASAYGPLAHSGEALAELVGKYFESGGGNPQDVADVILGLANTPHGERPTRTVVGADVAAVKDLNREAATAQRAVFEAFDYGDFAPLIA